MSNIVRGLIVCVSILVAIALFARLPVSGHGFDILALAAMIALAALVEWPRWRHPRTRRWPNKLGQV